MRQLFLLATAALVLLLTRYVFGPANDVVPPGEYRDAGLAALFEPGSVGRVDAAGKQFQPDLRWYCATDGLLLTVFAVLFSKILRRVKLPLVALYAAVAAATGLLADLLLLWFVGSKGALKPGMASLILWLASYRYLLFGLVWIWLGRVLMLLSCDFPDAGAKKRAIRYPFYLGIGVVTLLLCLSRISALQQFWNFAAFAGPMAYVIKIAWDVIRFGEFSDEAAAFQSLAGGAFAAAGIITIFGALFAPSRIEQATIPLVIALGLQGLWCYGRMRTIGYAAMA